MSYYVDPQITQLLPKPLKRIKKRTAERWLTEFHKNTISYDEYVIACQAIGADHSYPVMSAIASIGRCIHTFLKHWEYADWADRNDTTAVLAKQCGVSETTFRKVMENLNVSPSRVEKTTTGHYQYRKDITRHYWNVKVAKDAIAFHRVCRDQRQRITVEYLAYLAQIIETSDLDRFSKAIRLLNLKAFL